MNGIEMRKPLAFLLLFTLISSCKKETVDIIEPTPKLSVQSLFAINDSGKVTLGWTGIQNGTPVGFAVHRSSSSDFNPSAGTYVATLPATATRYVDSGITNGSTYFYRLVPIGMGPNGQEREESPSNVAIGKPINYGAVTSIVYSTHIQAIFNSSCAVHGCHVGADDGGHDKPSALQKSLHGGQFSLKSWEDAMRGGEKGNVIVPYKATKSHLVYHLNNDTLVAPVSLPHMPLDGFDLPRSQIQVLMRWIDEGATNDFGSVAYSAYPMGKVLVTNQAEDLIAVVDIATNAIARYVTAGVPDVFVQPPHAPHSIRVDRQKQFYYVCLIGAGKLLKYRVSDNALVGEVSGLVSPSEIAVTVSGDTGYVAQFGDAQTAIRMVNTQTMAVMGSPISHPSLLKPHGMHLSRDGRLVYITGYYSDNVLVLAVADGSMNVVPLAADVPPIPVGPRRFEPYYVEPSHDDRFVYVSCSKSNEVRVIERDSMKVVDSIAVGVNPLALDITPDDSRLYVANLKSNSVSVIKTATRQVISTIENVGVEPHGVKVSGDGKYVYVSCRNTASNAEPPHHPTSGSKIPGFVAVIDAASNTVVKRLEVGAFAAGVAIVNP
jgi:YVTN family beta-propeller protein